MDDSEYCEVLESEITKLRTVLAKNPDFQRLKLLEKHLMEYRAISPAAVTSTPKPPPHPIRDMSRYGRSGSMASVVVQASEGFLKKLARRAQSSDIVAALLEAGIDLPAEKASAYVSSYLSTSPLFDNVKGEGYGLVEWQTQNKLELT
jgi:hypothetical protein